LRDAGFVVSGGWLKSEFTNHFLYAK
jgi:hypothetical protein